MSQNTNPFPMTSGSLAAFRTGVNNMVENLSTLHSGASAPAVTKPYMLWADTLNGVLKQNDASNTPTWTILGPLNGIHGWWEPCHVFAGGIAASINVPLGSPRGNAHIKELVIQSDTATATSVLTSKEWTFQVRNKTTSVNLLSAPFSTGTTEIPGASAPLVIPLTTNLDVLANCYLELQIVKTGSPTSLAAAVLRASLGGWMVGA